MGWKAGISRTGRPWKAGLAATLALGLGLAPLPALADKHPDRARRRGRGAARRLSAAIFKVAGIHPPIIRIVASDEFNAFVTDNDHMFVNVGTMIETETPNELIGILAHETGHIVDDDMARLAQQVNDTKTALAAGDPHRRRRRRRRRRHRLGRCRQAGMGIFSAARPASPNAALLSFRRDQESGADRNAIKFLTATQQSGAGMLAVMKRLADENLLLSNQMNPYLQSAPAAARARHADLGLDRAKPLHRPQGFPRASAAPRSRAGEARRLHLDGRQGAPPLPDEGPEPAREIRARHPPPTAPASRGRRSSRSMP